MILKSLQLVQYRNYASVHLDFDDQFTILLGNNASGKTNLLEAIYVLSLTRSFRINDDRLLIQKDQDFAKIACQMEDGVKNIPLQMVISKQGKSLKAYHQPVLKTSEFIGMLNVVLFSPDDLSIFQDSPKERRRMIDQECMKLSKSYLQAMSQYQNLLKERNMLLKKRIQDETLLEVFDDQLVEVSYEIILRRRWFLEILNTYLKKYYPLLSFEKADVTLGYESFCMASKEELKESLKKMYQETHQKDLETGFTSIGIHKEDFIFYYNGENVLNKASQGQKRMVMLAYKMALLHTIEDLSKKKPILLLDDVLSELDDAHQIRLLDLCGKNYQCILTTTMIPSSFQNRIYTCYTIDNGNIRLN